jgi:hypothetical protein
VAFFFAGFLAAFFLVAFFAAFFAAFFLAATRLTSLKSHSASPNALGIPLRAVAYAGVVFLEPKATCRFCVAGAAVRRGRRSELLWISVTIMSVHQDFHRTNKSVPMLTRSRVFATPNARAQRAWRSFGKRRRRCTGASRRKPFFSRLSLRCHRYVTNERFGARAQNYFRELARLQVISTFFRRLTCVACARKCALCASAPCAERPVCSDGRSLRWGPRSASL